MILIMQTLIENNDADVVKFANKVCYWIDNGFKECGDTKGHGTGNTTSIWYCDYYVLKDPIYASLRTFVYHPISPCGTEANGSVMRTSINGVYKFRKLDIVITNTIKFASATHASPKTIASCLFISILISKILNYNL